MSEERIYFIRAGDRVKIGRSIDPARRLRQLETGSAEPLELLGTLPGGRAEESRQHDMWKYLRVRGEWFTASAELLNYARSAGKPPRPPTPEELAAGRRVARVLAGLTPADLESIAPR